MRNVIKQTRIGRNTISGKQDLDISELKQIFKIYDVSIDKSGRHSEGLWDAVATAYYMGYAVGVRAGKA